MNRLETVVYRRCSLCRAAYTLRLAELMCRRPYLQAISVMCPACEQAWFLKWAERFERIA